MLMSGNSVLEALPVYRLTLKRQKREESKFGIGKETCVLSGKVSSWG